MHKELLVKLLGLEADASDEAIANAATSFQSDMVEFKTRMESENERLTNAAAEAEAKASKAEDAANVIANENTTLIEELVNRDLETFKDVIVNADEVRTQLLSNRGATVAILKNIKVANRGSSRDKEPMHNSKTAFQPEPLERVTNSFSEEEAKRISNRAQELSRSLKISHQQAFIKARGEVAKAS